MSTNNLTTEQVESTFVGINQIIKAISTLKKKEEKEAFSLIKKVMKLKKVHLLSLCEDRSRQKTIPCSR